MDITQGEPRLDPSKWTEIIYNEIPELSEIAEIEMEQLFFEDSSDINRDQWAKLITFIDEKYGGYDGFVILHGTDTMAYTASALSFGLQNLSKPVILTGSQVPMSNIRSDARRNLVNAVEIATLPLNEVAICFNDFVFRGNRSTKTSIGDFDAFASPNFPPLAEIGLNIELHSKTKNYEGSLNLYPEFSDEVFLLKLHPNQNSKLLEKIDFSSTKALIVEAFGSGNFPLKGDQSLLPFFKKCISDGMLLIITSQADFDSVDLSKYESGRQAQELGALSAKDMTTEATLTKTMHLLANYSSMDEIKALFQQNLVGELTE